MKNKLKQIFSGQNILFSGLQLVAIALLVFIPVFLWGQLESTDIIIVGGCLLLLYGVLHYGYISQGRKKDRLFGQANLIMNRFLDGHVDDVLLTTQISTPEMESFIEKFNALLNKSASSRSLFQDVAGRLADNAGELSHIASDIEQRMQNQVVQTDEVHVTVDKLHQAISVASDVASQASALTTRSESEGNSGKEVMTEAMGGVMALASSVNEAGQIISELGEDSKSIGGIINVITGVAEQTNLLALNAAIEAARAGEQGRGFAVVADEVRSLASQTQESAKKINDIINKLLSHVDDATNIINSSMEQANASDELMEGVVVSYSELVGYLSEVSVLASVLANVAAEEKDSSSVAINQLSEVQLSSNDTIEQTKQLCAASAELGKMGQQLDILMGSSSAAQNSSGQPVEDDVELF